MEPLPLKGEILGIAKMVSDAAFFLKRKLRRPKQMGRWNAAAIPESVAGEKILPSVEAPVVRKGGKGKVRVALPDAVAPSVRMAYDPLR